MLTETEMEDGFHAAIPAKESVIFRLLSMCPSAFSSHIIHLAIQRLTVIDIVCQDY